MPTRKLNYQTGEKIETNSRFPSKGRSWRNIILVVVLIFGLLLWKFKGVFIAASVNGKPISRWQLGKELEKRFGSQVLDTLINERLILAASRQKGIFVTDSEIKDREKQVEQRVGGEEGLNQALKTQGLSRDDFRKQIEIQTSIEKLFGKEATVSGKEIEEYISKNKERYKNATNPASIKSEVENILRQQKTVDLFEKWFESIQKNAKIQKYL